jgi:hypothetical protein
MGMDDTPEYQVNQSRVGSVKNPRQNVECNRVSAEQPEFKPVKSIPVGLKYVDAGFVMAFSNSKALSF